MFSNKRPLFTSIIIYFFIIFILFQIKLPYFFSDDNELKEWGIGENKILFPIYIVSLIVSIFTLFIMNLV